MDFAFDIIHFLCYIDLCTYPGLMITFRHLKPLLGQCTFHGHDVELSLDSFGECWGDTCTFYGGCPTFLIGTSTSFIGI
jgi:hypothetical protein